MTPIVSEALRVLLRQEIDEARRQTDSIFDIISPAAFYERPIEARHRIIFYLGHLEAFDWNMIGRTSFGLKPVQEDFEQLFSFGIDPVDGNLPQDKASDWPDITAVRQYNVRARKAVDDCLDKADFSKRQQLYAENGLIFWTAIEHRLMHLETLSYMFHWLAVEMKKPLSGPDRPDVPAPRDPRPTQRKIRVPHGKVKLGMNRADTTAFGWDNEFERHIVNVPEFEIDVYKVTNGEFMMFVEAGGYQQSSFWNEGDWKWIHSEGIRHPKFWVKRQNEWWYRAMFGEIPMPESWPVYVSHAEASAYALWRGQVLPTEAEFHRASLGQKIEGNFGLQGWDPVAVHSNPNTASTFGVVEMIGNGWEWTSSVFAPFPGFERFPFYAGYSADFFDSKHFVLKGASARTASRLTRPSFRNWFQPHYPYIYAGFRCVKH
jgi:gamma-glutamyl hercynylcysteine S-oxide synthase